MEIETFTIRNRLGLHARAAALLVKTANRFNADITLEKDGIEVNGKYAGDVILEDRGRGTKSIVDLSILPEYQRKGIGKVVLEQAKEMGRKLTAVTRRETLDFFLKSGFVLTKRIKNYYQSGVDGYSIAFSNPV